MATITIIAGPPGVGKSTIGQEYVAREMEIIKKDEIIQTTKSFHYKLFQEIAVQKWLSNIHANADRDFAFELNLGMPRHYDFALSLKNKSADHRLKVVLFFTDDLELCKKRSDERFKSGLHEVNPIVLENMYHNTIPLFKHHFDAIDETLFVNTNRDNIFKPIGHYRSENQILLSFDSGNQWFTNDIKPFIENHIRRNQIQTVYSR